MCHTWPKCPEHAYLKIRTNCFSSKEERNTFPGGKNKNTIGKATLELTYLTPFIGFTRDKKLSQNFLGYRVILICPCGWDHLTWSREDWLLFLRLVYTRCVCLLVLLPWVFLFQIKEFEVDTLKGHLGWQYFSPYSLNSGLLPLIVLTMHIFSRKS